ncbi:hypothetical protein GGD62_005986 [Bradyrhizobium sp. ERR14]|nr:hypothetical protein [Bradyrhizobium sp. ERR14]
MPTSSLGRERYVGTLRFAHPTAPCLCRPLSIRFAKNIPLYRNSVSAYVLPIPAHPRGATMWSSRIASRACGGRGSVGTRGAGRAGSPCEPEASCGRAALPGFVSSVSFRLCRQGSGKLRRNGGPRVRQNRVVLAVVATVKSLRRCERAQPGRLHHPIRGAREARRNGRLPGDHGISRPTIAQGRPSDRHHLYAAVRFFCVCLLRSRPRVPAGTRPSLRPLGFRGSRDQAKLGRNAPRGRDAASAT